ncbi:MAG: substrate-binding periplasmic protein [Actinomycetota bacterium]
MKRVSRGLIVAALLSLVLAACGEDAPTPPAATGGGACDPAPLKTAGTLNVAAEHPYYEPFLIGEQANPTGFEAEVISEIARRLNVGTVKWNNIAFDQLYAPGTKNWDLGVSEITITPERDAAVDFSEPYFTANQGILVKNDSQYANATSVADIKDAKFGAEAGTTGLDYVQQNVQPTQDISQFDTTDAAAQALKVGTIDIQVIDVPIAIGIRDGSTDVQLKVVGQFITNENYGLAFEEESALKPCVDTAIKAMDTEGFLKTAQDKWFPGSTDLPVFQP